jgi:C1A family cysteine protease
MYKMPYLGNIDKKSDLELGFSPVENQETLGSCTGQGFAAYLEYLQKIDNVDHTDVSRLFIYYNERYLNNEIHRDSGARIRDGIKSLVRWGACDESLCPYDISRFMEKPSDEAYKDAVKRCIRVYRRLTTNDEIRYALSHGQPVIFGFAVFSSFNSSDTTNTGIVTEPCNWNKLIGGHCVVMAGHDDETEMFKWKNSYGRTWGDDGYGYFSYNYVDRYASDFWVIVQ